ncbi:MULTISPECIES: hypothetical protein [unclassified Streptomyces]|uniref:hypothetical protein n=1 Tax=unclassified Streptomyces TaxID=2593676 RepID=UPI0004C90239|nr:MULTISPECIES: hypothetical protein [unclassified Streptomyces]KOV86075.1 hypothetical protein ADL02_19470 [Streptomyces sp. NRRL WC-3723]
MSEPQFRYPRPDQPDAPIVYIDWHVASRSEEEYSGWTSPLDAGWWDGAQPEEREAALEKLRASVAEMATEDAGRPIGVGEVSYTVHRSGAGPVRPDEEPT